MRCPFCGSDNDRVIDTRSSLADSIIRRRRQCLSCGRRFTTEERSLDRSGPRVIKRNRKVEPFDPDKLRRSIHLACIKRGFTEEQLDNLADRVLYEIRGEKTLEIMSLTIGETVSRMLADLDLVAYVRFVSVFRNFESPDDFRHLLTDLERRNEE